MKTLIAALIAANALVAPPVAPPKAGEIPNVLSYLEKDGSSRNPFPDWVSAQRAVTPSGELDSTLFSPISRTVLTRILEGKATAEDCIEILVTEERKVDSGRPGYRPDLATAIRRSDWVFTARIQARESGFQGSTPGTLFQALPETTFKGPANHVDSVYFFVPAGEVPVGARRICIRNPNYSALPETGEEVLLLIDLESQPAGPFLWTGNETGIITLTKQGEVSLPKQYSSEEKALRGRNRTDFLHFVAESARRRQ